MDDAPNASGQCFEIDRTSPLLMSKFQTDSSGRNPCLTDTCPIKSIFSTVI